MSSMVSRAQVEEALWRISGRTSWQELEKVLKVIDAYAVTMAHRLGCEQPIPARGRVKDYLCKNCGQRKDITAFPLPKQKNPSLSYNCLDCQGVTVA